MKKQSGDARRTDFLVSIEDVEGDVLDIGTDVHPLLRTEKRAIAIVSIDAHDADGEEIQVHRALDRSGLIALRSVVDTILAAAEAVKITPTPPNDAIKSPRQTIVETARKELAAMSERLYDACARWELDAAARLAWVYSMHPALDGRRADMGELAEILRFVEVWDSSVDNYADCFKPAKGFTASDDDSEYDALSAVRQQVRQTMLAVLAIVDHLRAEAAQSLGKSPNTV